MPRSPSPLHVDVAVLGAGTAGLAAYRAATAHGARTVLIEAGPGGTTCAREGCMPSKLLIAAADAAHHARDAGGFGVDVPEVRVDGRRVLARVRAERDRFVGFVQAAHGGLPEGDRLRGWARFVGAHALHVAGPDGARTRVDARAVVVATGSTPHTPPLLHGLGDRLIHSDDVFAREDLPGSVAVFGPGVIGLELGQALHRLGVRVRVFGLSGSLGPLTDPAVRDEATGIFASELALDTRASVDAVEPVGDGVDVTFRGADGRPRTEHFELVLAATGRRPNVAGLGLEHTGLALDRHGVPVHDPETLRAGASNVFVAGDVTGSHAVLHEAADEGRLAGENAASPARPLARRAPMTVVFSDPQLAVVGGGWEAVRHHDPVVGAVSFADQGRSRVMRRNRGLLHVYADRRDGRFLGAELAGPDAEHLAHLLAWSLQARLDVTTMLAMPFYHPVVEEGLRTALRDADRQLRAKVPPDLRPGRVGHAAAPPTARP